jgi:hypothetical protein
VAGTLPSTLLETVPLSKLLLDAEILKAAGRERRARIDRLTSGRGALDQIVPLLTEIAGDF